MTISPQIRLLAVIGLLVALAGAAGFMVLGRSSGGDSTTPHVIKPLHPVAKHVTPPAKTKAPAKVKTPTKTHVKAHAAKKPIVHRTAPKHVVAPKPTPVAKTVATTPGLPAALAAALAEHPVVVVALYQVQRTATSEQRLEAREGTSADAAVGIDRLSLAEAQAGAREAHAGFVGVNVFHQSEAAPLTKMLGVLQDPSVIVFRRPGTVFVQLSGFADKDTIAQAAVNALQQP